MAVVARKNEQGMDQVILKHDHKLFNLRIDCRFDNISPDKVIFNLSYHRILSPLQKKALSLTF